MPAYLIVISLSILGLASALLQGIDRFKHVRPSSTIGNLLSPFAIIPLFSTFAFSTEANFFTRPFLRHPHSPYGSACSTAAESINL